MGQEVVGHNNNGVITGGAGWRFRRVGGAAGGGEESDINDGGQLQGDDDCVDEHKTTEMQTFIHLLKGYVGPGCLSLPWAISQLGIPLGCLACFVMAWWSSYNCWCVVRLKRLQQAEMNHNNQRRHAVAAVSRGTSTTTTSSDVVVDDDDGEDQNRHITYPEVAAWYCGRKMYQFTTLCICVQQLAICTVFLSFVGTNLQAVLNLVLGNVNHVTVISLALPAVMALSFLPDLKALAPVTAAGTALLLLGLLFLGIVIAVEWPHRPSSSGGTTTNDDGTSAASSIMLPNLEQIPISLCAVLYSYEGICLILPVESAMKRPRKFGPVFVYAMIAAGSIFAITGALAVAAFGRVTDGSITAFLLAKYGNGHSLRTWVLAANAAVSFSVLVTYPLQLFPALELLGPLCFSSPNDHRHHHQRRGDSITVQDLSIEGNGISTTTGLAAGAAAAGRSPTSGGDFIAIPESDPEGTERIVTNTHASNHLHHSDNEEPGDMTALSAPVVVPASATAGLWVADDGTTDDDDEVVVSPGSRVALVMVTYLVAVAVPNVQALISLAGALAGSSTALIIPPILQTAWYRRQQVDDGSSSRRLRAVDPTSAGLLVGGLIFLFIGTVASILDIIQVYRHHGGGEQEEGGS